MSAMSHRVETALNNLLVSASKCEMTSGGSGKPALTGTECSSALINIDRHHLLTLAIWHGFAVTGDHNELFHFILTKLIMAKHWYKEGLYLSSPENTQKINGLISCAIVNINKYKGEAGRPSPGARPLSSKQVAKQMGITERAYRKTWRTRFFGVCGDLEQWRLTAIQAMHFNC